MTNEEKIAFIILRTNKFEKYLKGIIVDYINAEKEEFVENVVLHNLVMNLNIKSKLIQIIINKEQLLDESCSKKFRKAVKILLLKRNQIAHSDSLAEYVEELVDVDFDWNPDGVMTFPIYAAIPSSTVEYLDENTGNIVEEELDKIYKDFKKYYINALECLVEIISKLGYDLSDIKTEKEELEQNE